LIQGELVVKIRVDIVDSVSNDPLVVESDVIDDDLKISEDIEVKEDDSQVMMDIETSPEL
jgi:hypothetical protein